MKSKLLSLYSFPKEELSIFSPFTAFPRQIVRECEENERMRNIDKQKTQADQIQMLLYIRAMLKTTPETQATKKKTIHKIKLNTGFILEQKKNTRPLICFG